MNFPDFEQLNLPEKVNSVVTAPSEVIQFTKERLAEARQIWLGPQTLLMMISNEVFPVIANLGMNLLAYETVDDPSAVDDIKTVFIPGYVQSGGNYLQSLNGIGLGTLAVGSDTLATPVYQEEGILFSFERLFKREEFSLSLAALSWYTGTPVIGTVQDGIYYILIGKSHQSVELIHKLMKYATTTQTLAEILDHDDRFFEIRVDSDNWFTYNVLYQVPSIVSRNHLASFPVDYFVKPYPQNGDNQIPSPKTQRVVFQVTLAGQEDVKDLTKREYLHSFHLISRIIQDVVTRVCEVGVEDTDLEALALQYLISAETHDINSALSAPRGFLEVYLTMYQDQIRQIDEKLLSTLERIVEAIKEAAWRVRTIDSLVSGSGASRMKMFQNAGSMAENVIDLVTDKYQYNWEHINQLYTIRLVPENLDNYTLHGYPSLIDTFIEGCIRNAIENAASKDFLTRAAPKDFGIGIALEIEQNNDSGERFLKIIVSDYLDGVSPALIAKIHRGEKYASTKSKEKNKGVGIGIMRDLANLQTPSSYGIGFEVINGEDVIPTSIAQELRKLQGADLGRKIEEVFSEYRLLPGANFIIRYPIVGEIEETPEP